MDRCGASLRHDGPVQARHALRAVVNVVNLATPLGLVLAAVGRTRLRDGPDGLVLATGWRASLPRARAFTVGNVVISREEELPEPLLAHEARHSTQWAACVVLFLPLYLLAAGWSWLRTADTWSRNWFEVHANLTDGGYVPRPVRSLRSHQRGRGSR